MGPLRVWPKVRAIWEGAFWGRGPSGSKALGGGIPSGGRAGSNPRNLAHREAGPFSPSAPFPQGPLGFGD